MCNPTELYDISLIWFINIRHVASSAVFDTVQCVLILHVINNTGRSVAQRFESTVVIDIKKLSISLS